MYVLRVLLVQQWRDLEAGLAEMRRVTSGPVVIMTADPEALADLWVAQYSPAFHATERRRYPSLERIADVLGGRLAVRPLVIPFDCRDGFTDAFYGRPEEMLDQRVRNAQSAWSFVGAEEQAEFEQRLRDDLDMGVWDDQYGHLRAQPEFVSSIRILVA